MKLILQSVLYCSLLSTVAHCVELEVNPELKKRLSVWMESRLRRHLTSMSAERVSETEQFVTPEKLRDTLIPHSSNGISIRTRRSKNSNQSRRPGCSLGTCTVHDLAHRLHQLNDKRVGTAPIEKISPHGYGRRRRSVPARGVTLGLEQGRLRPVWRDTVSRVHKLEALLLLTRT
ncbi:hypothetical protein NHX12_006327 [Muraenolepis orangiensis]|uniref:Adrenomedullin n=1 Tax=Muraenolepis orangiensis TaxID=630683 RepID=A0A9Q0ICZ5_9TELE|nr:hypothetical protein NHX12_006327 [Muraenolepis orangiensis]